MAKAKVYGVQHRKGTSKKGNNFDADILHVVFLDPPRTSEFTGCETGQVWCERSSGVLSEIPKIGDTIDVYYNRSGFVDEVTICK